MNGELCYDGMFENQEEQLAGQAEAWKYTFAFVDSLAVKSAVLLGIPDIIERHGPRATLSLSQIAAELPTENPHVHSLFRILRFLVAKNFFRAEGDAELKYGLTPVSKCFVKDCAAAPPVTMNASAAAPTVMNTTATAPPIVMNTAATTPPITMNAALLLHNDVRSAAAWQYLNESVLHGGVPFDNAHGVNVWEYCAAQPEYGDLYNQAMACNAKVVMKAVLSEYEGFRGLSSLVDVGGGIGANVAEIVKSHPSINAINYDLPHVIATAPHFPGVKHVGGDMFREVPSADAVFMKWIMHDWGDEECIKILKQCRRAIGERGKVIIVDAVLNGGEKRELDPTLGLVLDLVMVAFTAGGKERSEEEFKNVLKEAGFPRFNFIPIPPLQYIIEAFPY